MTHKCPRCKETKKRTEFRKNGTGYCKPCRAQYLAEYRRTPSGRASAKAHKAKRKQAAQDLQVKLAAERGNRCHCCSKQFHPAAMDWHHIGPKKHSISNMIVQCRGLKDIAEEIAKCVLVCCVCHRLHHAGVLFIQPPEGMTYVKEE